MESGGNRNVFLSASLIINYVFSLILLLILNSKYDKSMNIII